MCLRADLQIPHRWKSQKLASLTWELTWPAIMLETFLCLTNWGYGSPFLFLHASIPSLMQRFYSQCQSFSFFKIADCAVTIYSWFIYPSADVPPRIGRGSSPKRSEGPRWPSVGPWLLLQRRHTKVVRRHRGDVVLWWNACFVKDFAFNIVTRSHMVVLYVLERAQIDSSLTNDNNHRQILNRAFLNL